jgi:hypothetical protein
MSLSLVQSRVLVGLRTAAVTVEVHLANGLPQFTLVGLADTEVKESRERVRSALATCALEFPHNKRITVNLAPADLPKDSGRFDLPIALGILAASGQVDTARLAGHEFAGELRYIYAGSKVAVNPDTTEVYVAGTYGPATLKYSHSTTNLFGFASSKGSGYLDLNATFDLGNGFTVVPHIGYQKVKDNSPFSYYDYSVTLNKDFGNGLSGSLMLVDTDTSAYVGFGGKDLGKAGIVLGLKYTF